MKLKVLQRWSLLQLLPEKGSLAESFLIDNVRRKLSVDAGEMDKLQMVTGVVCNKCGSPVDNRGSEKDPNYFCLACGDYVDDTKGLPNRTIWDAAADVGKDINFKKSELRLFVSAFNQLDEAGSVEPRHVEAWKLLSAEDPKMFPIPDEARDESVENKENEGD